MKKSERERGERCEKKGGRERELKVQCIIELYECTYVCMYETKNKHRYIRIAHTSQAHEVQ